MDSLLLFADNPLFGAKYLVWVALSVVVIVVGAVFAQKLKFKTICNTLFAVLICSQIIQIFYYTLTNADTMGGVMPKTDLPFHLCSIQLFLVAFVCFANNEKLKRGVVSFMYPTCLCGGFIAILIATQSARNGHWIISTQYFIHHSALTIFGLYLLFSKEFKFTLNDYFSFLKGLLVAMFFAFFINSMLYDGVNDINFMFVASPPAEGLPFLTEEYGWGVYIVHYAFAVIFCCTLCFIRPIVEGVKKLRNKRNNVVD